MAAIYAISSDGTISYTIRMTVNIPTHASETSLPSVEPTAVELQYKLQTDTTWNTVISTVAEGESSVTVSVTGLSAGTTYDYRVRLLNSLGIAGDWYTSTFTVASKTTGPGAATNLSVTAETTGNYVSWDPPSDNDVSHFEVYRNTSNDFNTASVVGRSDSDHFLDTLVTNGTVYYYWVKTVDTTGLKSTQTTPVNVSTLVDRNVTYYQSSAPSSHNAGDYWIDTDDGYTLYVSNGTTWDPAEVQELAASKITAGTINSAVITLDTANGAIKSNNFTSGSSGFKIDGTGSAEFNDVVVRGVLATSNSVANSSYADKVMRGANTLWSQDTAPPNVDWTTWNDAGSIVTFYKYSSNHASATATNRYKYDNQTFLFFLTGTVDLTQNAEQSSGRTAEIEIQYRIDSGSWVTVAPTTTKYHIQGTSSTPSTAQSHTNTAQSVASTLDLSTATDKVDFKMRQKGKGLVQMTMSIVALNI